MAKEELQNLASHGSPCQKRSSLFMVGSQEHNNCRSGLHGHKQQNGIMRQLKIQTLFKGIQYLKNPMHKKKKTHNVSAHICPTGCCTKQAGNPSEQESRSTISCFTVGQHRLPELSVRLCTSSAPKIGTSTNKIAMRWQSSLSGY